MSTTLGAKPSAHLNPKIKEAIAKARSLSEQGQEQLAAGAWKEVEELRAKMAEQQAEAKTNFEQYCEENPAAVGCLIYDV